MYSQYPYTHGKSKLTFIKIFLHEVAYTRYGIPWLIEWMNLIWHKVFCALSFTVQLFKYFSCCYGIESDYSIVPLVFHAYVHTSLTDARIVVLFFSFLKNNVRDMSLTYLFFSRKTTLPGIPLL
jgi:hypothetical protein